jgi:ferredoxin-NADP reductase
MMTAIDNFLNRITMYRLVLYYLAGLILGALVLSMFGKLPFTPISLLYSTLFITVVCWLANTVFAWAFEAPTNLESVYITALILVLIISPPKSAADASYFAFIAWAALWAMAGKYILAVGKKHLFNPAAMAVALTALTINQSASWWVGTAAMLPLVLLGGILVVRKIRRWDLVYSFLLVVTVFTVGTDVFIKHIGLYDSAYRLFLDSAVLFFAFVMLTEPLTTPPTQNLQMAYGVLVGLMFSPYTHLGGYYFTPETALLAGNLFVYLTGPKQKLMLKLKQKLAVASGTYDFVYAGAGNFNFRPGQYLEWTLAQDSPDRRGSRRYFTMASSPTEADIRLGVKFYNPASSFKQTMLNMQPGQKIVASQLAGDFTLPKNRKEKLAFVAGGIGITPFRSMVKYLIDKNEKRDIIIFYSNRTITDIAYKEIFDEAQSRLGIKTVYVLTDKNTKPGWDGEIGHIDGKMIARQVPDYLHRVFYLSGPHAMVAAFEKTLKNLGVSRGRIKIDFFPGFV